MEAYWSKPVVLATRNEETHEISDLREAVDCMMHWPSRDEKAYRKAVRLCLFALAGERKPEKARAAFVAAAREANCLVRS